MSTREVSLERLEEAHSFPCDYIFKVIGSNSPKFVSKVVQVAINVISDDADPDVDTRESSGGKYLSVTMSVSVSDAETVLDVYDVLQDIDGVRFIL